MSACYIPGKILKSIPKFVLACKLCVKKKQTLVTKCSPTCKYCGGKNLKIRTIIYKRKKFS